MNQDAEPDGELLRFPQPRTCPFGPPAAYAAVRSEEPVSEVELVTGRRVWMVSRMEDALAVLEAPGTSNDRTDPDFPATRLVPTNAPPEEKALNSLEGEAHTAYRRMVSPEFSMKRVQAMRPKIQEIVEQAIDGLVSAGSPADLVEKLSLPIPSRVICELLGVPYRDHAFFQEASATMLSRNTSLEEWRTALGSMHGYLVELVASKRDSLESDMITRLHARVRDGLMRESQLAGFAFLALLAGHETTANMISLGVLTFIERPDIAERLRSEPTLMPRAVEEFLRYHSVLDDVPARLLTEDMTLGGVSMKRGDGVAVSAVAANFDDEWFDDPLKIDFDRENLKHLAFGAGRHQCLGASLARLELEITYEAVLRRLPTLRLARPIDEVPFKYEDLSYGMHELPVAW